jgi:hypothetical protein
MRAGKTGSKLNLSSSSAWQSHLQECPWIHDLKGCCWSFPAFQISPTCHIIFADFEVVVKCNVCVCVYSRLYYRAGWMWQVGECKDFHNWHPWEGLTSTQKTHTRLFA